MRVEVGHVCISILTGVSSILRQPSQAGALVSELLTETPLSAEFRAGSKKRGRSGAQRAAAPVRKRALRRAARSAARSSTRSFP